MTNLAEAVRLLSTQADESTKPTMRVFGTVTSLEPFKVQINEKLTLEKGNLVITQTIRNYITRKYIKIGSKVVMTRQRGGQLYIVDDMIECDNDLLDNLAEDLMNNKDFIDWSLNHTHNCPSGGGTSSKGSR